MHHLWLARLATDVYVQLIYRLMPDPTEPLLGKIREFIEANAARFLVGIQQHDDALVIYFEANTMPFVTREGAVRLGSDRMGLA